VRFLYKKYWSDLTRYERIWTVTSVVLRLAVVASLALTIYHAQHEIVDLRAAIAELQSQVAHARVVAVNADMLANQAHQTAHNVSVQLGNLSVKLSAVETLSNKASAIATSAKSVVLEANKTATLALTQAHRMNSTVYDLTWQLSLVQTTAKEANQTAHSIKAVVVAANETAVSALQQAQDTENKVSSDVRIVKQSLSRVQLIAQNATATAESAKMIVKAANDTAVSALIQANYVGSVVIQANASAQIAMRLSVQADSQLRSTNATLVEVQQKANSAHNELKALGKLLPVHVIYLYPNIGDNTSDTSNISFAGPMCVQDAIDFLSLYVILHPVTILFAPGVYHMGQRINIENFLYSSRLIFMGSSITQQPTTLKVTAFSGSSTALLDITNSPGISFNNIHFEGTLDTVAVSLDAAGYIYFGNCVFDTWSQGIVAGGISYAFLSSCTLRNFKIQAAAAAASAFIEFAKQNHIDTSPGEAKHCVQAHFNGVVYTGGITSGNHWNCHAGVVASCSQGGRIDGVGATGTCA